MSKCESLRELERITTAHQGVLTKALGFGRRTPPSNLAFNYSLREVIEAGLGAAIRH